MGSEKKEAAGGGGDRGRTDTQCSWQQSASQRRENDSNPPGVISSRLFSDCIAACRPCRSRNTSPQDLFRDARGRAVNNDLQPITFRGFVAGLVISCSG